MRNAQPLRCRLLNDSLQYSVTPRQVARSLGLFPTAWTSYVYESETTVVSVVRRKGQ